MKQKTNLAHLLVALTTLTLYLIFPGVSIFAQEKTEQSSASADTEKTTTDDNSTINNIKKVIQEKQVELGSGTAKLRSSRAYLAKVVRVSEETLTVTNHTGNKIIPLEKGVTAIEKDGEEVGIEQLAVDDWVGVRGELVDDNLRINKISVYDKDFTPRSKIIAIGTISSLGRSDLKFSPRSGAEELNFSLNSKTVFQDMSGETVKSSDFYEELQALVVAFADANGNYMISTIRALSSFER